MNSMLIKKENNILALYMRKVQVLKLKETHHALNLVCKFSR